MLSAAMVWAQSDPDWTDPGSNLYPEETPVYVSLQVDGNAYAPAESVDYIVAAFVGDECRAVDKNGSSAGNGAFYYTLRVRGTSAEVTAQPTITFKIYDRTGQLIYNPEETAVFDGETHGYPSNLFVVNLASISSIKEISPITITVGETVNLMDYLSIVPPNATAPEVTWSYIVDASTYFTLADGQITGVSPTPDAAPAPIGVRATFAENHSVDLDVVVLEQVTIAYQGGVNANTILKMPRGTSLATFLADYFLVSPDNAPDKSVTYLSSAPEIISVNNTGDNGEALAVGTSYVTVTTNANAEASLMFTIHVVVPVDGVAVDPAAITVNKGDNAYEAIRDIVIISPNDATYDKQDLVFSRDEAGDPLYNIVNAQGVALANGTVTVYVSDEEGSKYVAEVTVTVVTPLTEITTTSETVTVNRNDADVWDQIAAEAGVTAVPGDASYGAFTYTPTDPSVVSTGGVALAAGQTNVTISSTNYPGITKVVTVVVEVPVETLTVVIDEQRPVRYEDFQVTLTPTPVDATINTANLTVNLTAGYDLPEGWEAGACTVNENGLVTGPVTLTVTPYVLGALNVMATYGNAVINGNNSTSIGADYELSAGWNWMSVYQTGEPVSVNSAILNDAEYFNGTLVDLRTANALLYNDPELGLFGDLLGLTAGDMYKVKVSAKTSLALFGAQTPSTYYDLAAGWNWFVYPYQYDHTVAELTAQGALPTDAEDGDMIVSKASGFLTYDGGQWTGSLETFSYGEGYMYYSQSANDDNWVDEITLEQQKPVPSVKSRGTANRSALSHWQYDASRFMNNMSMVAAIDGLDDAARYTVGAFVGDECRGEGVCVGGRFFITVHADKGEQVSFKLYDQTTGGEIDLNETVRFLQRVGSVKAPVSLSYDEMAMGIGSVDAARFNLDNGQCDIYDLNGRRVAQPTKGLYIVNGKKVLMK